MVQPNSHFKLQSFTVTSPMPSSAHADTFFVIHVRLPISLYGQTPNADCTQSFDEC
jgi:hypothetical protein